MPRTQQIPGGYTMLRRRGTDLFTFMIEADGKITLAPQAWGSKAETLDAMWQHFRNNACKCAACDTNVFVLDCLDNNQARALLPERALAARSSPAAA